MAPFASEPTRAAISGLDPAKGRLFHSMFRLLMVSYRGLFARKRLYPFNRLLFNLSLRGVGILSNEDGSDESTGEAHFLRQISSAWGQSPIIFDVGAHVGEYSNRIMELTPGARVYAFEPHPKAFGQLHQQALRYGYSALNVACGCRRESLNLYDYQDDDGSPHASLYREVLEALHRGRAVAHRVELIVLDDFIAEHGISRVGLIKIDTEGHELKVLEGLRRAIGNGMIDAIQFEFNAMNVISRCFFRDFFEILPHYRFHRMLRDGLVPLREYSPVLCEIFAFQNIVAIRNDCGLKL